MYDLNPDKVIEPVASRNPAGNIFIVASCDGELLELPSIVLNRRGWRRKTKDVLKQLGILVGMDEIYAGPLTYGECTVAQYQKALKMTTKLRALRNSTSRGRV